MNEIQIPNKEELIRVMRKNHIVFAAIFGSRAKGTAKPGSDYDFLVEFDPKYPIPFSRFFKINNELEEMLQSEVDIVTVYGLNNKRFRDEVINTMKVLYGNKSR